MDDHGKVNAEAATVRLLVQVQSGGVVWCSAVDGRLPGTRKLGNPYLG